MNTSLVSAGSSTIPMGFRSFAAEGNGDMAHAESAEISFAEGENADRHLN